ncbi:G surface protein, allelic form 156-like [Biomphalaria glabrata]|uniref:G surface protein, allelic form 156-like n=1 Tax=Biomphalaria glabrata TaxID=6526 RepID=A0A9W3AV27_BIOGL|nr:G surface protein, allelic form 156-like [Biomphalaria glabrata]KAI8762448.1 hypothetical protein BgiMline_005384 [Biomphalaria glabrata]
MLYFALVLGLLGKVVSEDVETALASTSQQCQSQVTSCTVLNSAVNLFYYSSKYCEAVRYSTPSFASLTCLVEDNGCTLTEYFRLRNAACGTNSTTGLDRAENVSIALVSSSQQCRLQISNCIVRDTAVTKLYMSSKYCEAMQYSTASFSSQTCLVINSGCTQSEYDSVRNAACGTNLTTNHNGTKDVETALASTSQQCQSQVTSCTALDITVQNLYTSLKYCEAIRYSTPSFASLTCLVKDNGCTLNEYFRLRNAACGTNSTTGLDRAENVSIALVSSSQQCRLQISNCIVRDKTVTNLYMSSKYCEAMQYSTASFSSQTCLVIISGCTQSEYDSVRNAACGTNLTTNHNDTKDVETALASTNQQCQSQVTSCTALDITVQNMYTSLKYCEAIRYSTPSFASLTCLVKDNGCTLNEYFRLRNAACGTNSTTGLDRAENVSIALVSSSQQCRLQISNCILRDTTVTNLYMSSKYCEAMQYSTASFSSQTCLVINSGCTQSEYDSVRNAACGTNLTTNHNDTKDVETALASTNQQCQSQVTSCTALDIAVQNLYTSLKYCEAVRYSTPSFASLTCLVKDNGCTLTEYFRLRNAACGTNSTTGLDRAENVSIALVSSSQQCRLQISNCIVRDTAVTNLYMSSKYCEAMQYSTASFSSQTCLVINSGCTQSEYDSVRNAACGTNLTTNHNDTKDVETALASTNQQCQSQVTSCTALDITVQNMYTSLKYCEAIRYSTPSFASLTCLVKDNGCTLNEYFRLRNAACGTNSTTGLDRAENVSIALVSSSQQCRLQISNCILRDTTVTNLYMSSKYCEAMQYSTASFSSQTCLVINSGCTQSEYDSVRNAACGTNLTTNHNDTKDVETALASTNQQCQSQVTSCTALDIAVQNLYTSLKYCEAVRYSTPSFASLTCLVKDNGCTLTEYFRLRNAACGTNSTTGLDRAENVSIALVSSSQQCRLQISNCIVRDTAVTNLYMSSKYCEAMQYSTASFSSQTCLVINSGCTQSEYDSVRNAACGTNLTTNHNDTKDVETALASTNQQCQSQVTSCTALDITVQNMYTSLKYCEAIRYSTPSFASLTCLVKDNGCTLNEYFRLRNAACGTNSTTGLDRAENVSIALVSSSQQCRLQISNCILRDTTVTNLYMSSKYCEAMQYSTASFSSQTCLVINSGCTQSEYDSVRNAACGTNLTTNHNDTKDVETALASTNQQCQSQVTSCTALDIAVQNLYTSLKYCEAVRYSTPSFASLTCLVKDNGCTLTEYFRLRNAACGTNSTTGLDRAENVSIALVSSSQQCRLQISNCIVRDTAVTNLYMSSKYCEAMQYSTASFSSQTCLVINSGCTQSEYDSVRNAACGTNLTTNHNGTKDVETALASTNQQCQSQVTSCTALDIAVQKLYTSLKYCEAIRYSTPSFASLTCLVKDNGCTLNEYFRLRNAACGTNSTTGLDRAENVSIALVSSSQQCRLQISNCILRDTTVTNLYMSSKYCEAMQYSTASFSSQTCLVINSGCTQSEYDSVRNAACGTNLTTNHNGTKDVETALASTNQQCQSQVTSCTALDIAVQKLYTSLKYCEAIRYSTPSFVSLTCLVKDNGCTLNEYFRLRNAACGTNSTTGLDRAENVSIALVSSSQQCRLQISNCIVRDTSVNNLYMSSKYCEAMQYSTASFSSQTCLVINSGCTQSEYDSVRNAACGTNLTTNHNDTKDVETALASTSQQCQSQVTSCTALDIAVQNLYTSLKYCEAIRYSTPSFAFLICLVENRGCTLTEYFRLRNAACGTNSTTGLDRAENVSIALVSSSQQCRLQISNCIVRDTTVTNLYMSSKYCEAMQYLTASFSSQTCLVINSGCTQSEYDSVRNAACGTNLTTNHNDTKDVETALASTSQQCQSQVTSCIALDITVQKLYTSLKYCEAIRYSTPSFAFLICLVENRGCTLTEYFRLRNAACGTSSTTVENTAGENVSIALVSSSQQCRSQISSCIAKDNTVKNLYMSSRYCEALQFLSISSKTCLDADSGCTQREYNMVTQAACRGSSLISGTLSLVISSFVILLKKL